MTPQPHLSVHREVEQIKELVARKTIVSCAEWLRDRGHADLAEAMLEEKLESASEEQP